MTDDLVKTVPVGGQRLRVAIRPGTGGGPPLLVCNGIGTPLEALAPFTGALDPAITVVRFDVPGTGGSPATRLPYSVPWLASLAARMMGRLGYDRFDVLGISWGGGLAQQLAIRYPRRCRRLVPRGHVDRQPHDPRHPPRPAAPRLAPPDRDPAHAARIAGDIYGGALRRLPHLAAPIALGYPAPASAAATSTSCWHPRAGPACPGSGSSAQPVLILAGDDDPIIPLPNARLMAWLLPAARLHVYQDGHLGLLTRAAELAPLVSDFLLAVEPAALPAVQ